MNARSTSDVLPVDLTRRLASGVLRGFHGPRDAVAQRIARLCLVDWVGVVLAAGEHRLVGALRSELSGSDGEASVLGTPLRCPARYAAFVNGVAGHALEYDNTSPASGAHPAAAVFPAALAAAEASGADGETLLAAYVVACDAMLALGRAAGEGHYAVGFHATATIGVFGAAAAAAALYSSDVDVMHSALALAASQGAGLRANFGTDGKPLQVGHASACGLEAARLATLGVRIPRDAIGGRFGFLDTHSPAGRDPMSAPLMALRHGAGTRDTVFKFHASCHGTHAVIDGLLGIWSDGLRADDLQALVIEVPEVILGVCGLVEPRTVAETQFSLGHAAALVLCRHDTADLRSFGADALHDPELAKMRRRIQVRRGEAGHVSMTLQCRDGRHLSTRRPVLDQPCGERPPTDAVHRKFLRLASPTLGRVRAVALLETLDTLSSRADLAEVVRSAQPTAERST